MWCDPKESFVPKHMLFTSSPWPCTRSALQPWLCPWQCFIEAFSLPVQGCSFTEPHFKAPSLVLAKSCTNSYELSRRAGLSSKPQPTLQTPLQFHYYSASTWCTLNKCPVKSCSVKGADVGLPEQVAKDADAGSRTFHFNCRTQS